MLSHEPREFPTPIRRTRAPKRPPIARRSENPFTINLEREDWISEGIRRHYGRLIAMFLEITHDPDDAKGLFSPLWLKLAGKRKPDDPQEVERVIVRAGRCVAIDLLRRRGSEAARHQARGEAGLVPVDLSQANGRDAARWLGRDADDGQDDDRRERLYAGIARLPEKHRTILVDYRLEGRPVKEIAGKNGVTGKAIYKRLEKAFKALLAILL